MPDEQMLRGAPVILDRLSDDGLLVQWIATLTAKDTAQARLEDAIDDERALLAVAQRRGLAWARTGPGN